MSNDRIITKLKENVFCIKLNRPEKSNSYDKSMAMEIKNAFLLAKKSHAVMVMLSANGANFSCGADLEWMSESSSLSHNENIADMSILKEMYEAILSVEIPIIGVVQGRVMGGGIGLVASCDIVFSDPNVSFSISEAKWGLIPGIITPIVIQKIGPSRFLELSLSTRTFNFEEALEMKLIHHSIDKMEIIVEQIKKNSVFSTKTIKKIVREEYLNYSSMDKLLKISSDMRLTSDFKNRVKNFIDS